jgi:hypothetical protein
VIDQPAEGKGRDCGRDENLTDREADGAVHAGILSAQELVTPANASSAQVS